MVSNANDDLPEPDSPVITTSLSRGFSTSTFLRLCSRAPLILIPVILFMRVARSAERPVGWLLTPGSVRQAGFPALVPYHGAAPVFCRDHAATFDSRARRDSG